MSNWKQYTYVNDGLKYEPRIISSDRLVEMMAALLFQLQVGYDITMSSEIDEDYNVTAYIVRRVISDRVVMNRFERMEG